MRHFSAYIEFTDKCVQIYFKRNEERSLQVRETSCPNLAAFYDCDTPARKSVVAEEDQTSFEETVNASLEADELSDFANIVRRRVSVQIAAEKFKNSEMESKKDNKGPAADKIVEAFMKTEMKKNMSFNDLNRVDSGTKRNGVGGGGVSPENGASESDFCLLKNPKKLRVFEGMLNDDLPLLNSKIVRIFTSSTFTGRCYPRGVNLLVHSDISISPLGCRWSCLCKVSSTNSSSPLVACCVVNRKITK